MLLRDFVQNKERSNSVIDMILVI